MTRFSIRLGFATFAAIALQTPTAQAQPSFQGLGDLPGGFEGSVAEGVSADGSVVVGDGNWAGEGGDAFRWTVADGMVPIVPGGSARGVSADGSVVVGQVMDSQAFRWTAAGGTVPLGDLPGGTLQSSASAVSSDGSTVVGDSSSSISILDGFRWTQATGMTRTGDLGGDGLNHRTFPHDTNADGTVVVGFSDSAMGFQAFRWTEANGMIGLGDLSGRYFASTARAVNSDGSVVTGTGYAAMEPPEVFRWTEATGMIGLGFEGFASDISADGSIIVGLGDPGAFIWDEVHGRRDLKDVLVQQGLDLNGWTLFDANGISDDGLTIVGRGINPSGRTEAWIATLLPERVPGDTNGDGLVNIDDLNNVRNHLGDVGSPGIVGDAYPFDGLVDIDDLSAVRNHFGAAAAAVPEPSSAALAALTVLAAASMRWRRWRRGRLDDRPSTLFRQGLASGQRRLASDYEPVPCHFLFLRGARSRRPND